MRTITSRRFAVGLAAAIGLALSSWCLAQNDKAEKAKPKVVLPPPKITISKETTWAIEPLRDDGFIDYLEVLNRRYSKDVTVDNNACVMLYQAMGPSPEGTRQPDRFFRRLGIEPLPDEGKYFQPLGNWIQQRADAPADVDLVFEPWDRPWKGDEFPLIVAWLRDNETALLTVTAASERPRYFSPLVNSDAAPDGGMIELPLGVAQMSRQLARALMARSMWELAEGSQVDAWRDLMTVHRFARLVGQGPTLMESLVGIAIESMAFQGEFRFLSETKPSAKMLAHYRKQLDRLPPRASVADKLDTGERSMFLDCVQRVARGQLTLVAINGGRANQSLMEKLAERVIAQAVDWNEVCKSGNQWHDRLTEVARKPNDLERSEALRKLDQDLEVLVAKRSEPNVSQALLGGGKPAITQAMSDTLILLLQPSVRQILRAEGRVIQRMHNLKLAFALAEWHNEHDSYPESLDKLAPNYIAIVPKDHFNGQPLKYEQTADSYQFYSVGENEKDDGGSGYDDKPQSDDLVVRMPWAIKDK